MICKCGHEAIPYDSEKGQIGDCFYSISWELIDVTEYLERLDDGRTTFTCVCPSCYEKYTGLEYLTVGETLHNLNKRYAQ